MKFSQLQIGQRFVLAGEPYRKTGPLTASHESSGKQRLVAYAARIEARDAESAPGTAGNTDLVPKAVAEQALAEQHRQFLALLDELAPRLGEKALAVASDRLETARRSSLELLEGGAGAGT